MNTEIYKIKVIKTITILMLMFIPLSMGLNYINDRDSFTILYFVLFFVTLYHSYCFKKEQDSTKGSEQILIILFGLYFAFFLIGEQKSFDVLWGLIIPPIAVITSSLKRLKFWLFLTVSITAVMIVITFIAPQYVHYEIFPLFSLLWALIFISYMAYSYKSLQAKLEEKILSYQNSLEDKVEEAVKEITLLNHNLEETQIEILEKLGTLGEYRSKNSTGHLSRVGLYVKELSLLAGVDEDKAKLFAHAAPLHDIGQVAIDDSIVNKPEKLTPQEYQIMKTHTTIGQDILGGSDKPLMQTAEEIAAYHHEKYDGTGYPKGLQGEDIPLSAKIVAIVDVFDSLYSNTSYKKNWSNEDIINHFKNEKGKHFDPYLTDLFLENIEIFVNIYETRYISK